MKKCIGVDCEYFDHTSRIDVFTGNAIPYCKQQRKQLKVDQDKRIVYVDDCVPSIRVINICGNRYGAVSGKEY